MLPQDHLTRMRIESRHWLAIHLFCIVTLISPFSQAADLSQQRPLFLAAEKALAANDLAQYQELKAKLLDYPLLPYLEIHEVPSSDGNRVRAFIARYDNTPFAWELRRRHLLWLTKNKEWQAFLDMYKTTSNLELQCLRLQALFGSGDKGAMQEAAKVWRHGDSLPDGCEPVFETLRKEGKLSSQMVWERMDRVRDKKSDNRTTLMKYLKRLLPSSEHGYHDLWMQSLTSPQKVVNSPLLASNNPSRGDLLVHSISALGWLSSDNALATWHKTKGWQSPDQQRRTQLGLGKALHRHKHPKGIEFFDQVRSCQLEEDLCALRVRHALAMRRWDKALAWINEMPEAERKEEQWGYWKARALDQQGKKAEAQALFREVAKDRSFYGFMAADQANVPYRLDHRPVPKEIVQRAAAQPSVQRATELYQLGRLSEAGREINWAKDVIGREGLMGAARLAMQWGWIERAILILLEADHWDDLEIRFPLLYRDLIEAEANKHGIDSAWIFAIMRQESLFNRSARSPVGALGLMQLMPPTARLVASKLKLPKPQEGDLLRPEVNIPLGSYYLKMLHDQFKGWECLATPSYNAGPGRTVAWMSGSEVPIDLWLEDIPFEETRLYAQRVLSYQVLYQYRLGKKVSRLRDQMPRLVSRSLLRQEQTQQVVASDSTAISQEIESRPEPKPESKADAKPKAFIDL